MSSSFINYIKQYDAFGQALPGFNLKGEQEVKTGLGTLMSINIFIIVFIYALAKSGNIQSVSGQTIVSYDEEFASVDNKLHLDQIGLKLAFGFYGVKDAGLLYDPRYVRWIAHVSTSVDNEHSKQRLELRKCTEDDFDGFYPIVED